MIQCAVILASLAGCVPPSEAVSQDRLMENLRALPVHRAALGDAESVAGLADTERWIADQLRALGYTPELEPIEWALPARDWPGTSGRETGPGEPRVWHNIIVELPGREAPHEVLLVGAHFDAAPKAPGADDDGTGTAALLELARVLKDEPMRRTVRLVFFNLEEIGLVGSRQNAEHVRAGEPGPKPPAASEPGQTPPDAPASAGPARPPLVGMLSLEMLGYFSDAPGSQKSPIKAIPGVFTPPTVGDFISLVTISKHREFCGTLAAAMQDGAPGLRVLRADFLPVAMPDMLRSDHAPYLALGVPAVMVTDTANFRNPNYHRPTDTVDTIDAARFTQVVRGLARGIVEIAGSASGADDVRR